MTRDEKLEVLRDWEASMRTCDETLSKFTELTGSAPESPMVAAVTDVMGMATRRTVAVLGCGDEWLEAWWLEHHFGERPMKAGLVGEPLREIRTIEELAALIFEDANL